jgi:hypothetical protein
MLLALNVPPGKRALLLFLIGLILGFSGARINARLMRARASWWFRSYRHGDVHVHHVVYGVIVMVASGGLTFALASDTDWRSVLAWFFGVGTGMVLDEYALILHLEDVYWEEAGRKSIDAVVLTASLALVLLFGLMPFRAETRVLEGPRWVLVAIIAFNLVCLVIAGLKGKRLVAALGLLIPLMAPVAAITIAKPDSPWAHRRYAGRPELLLKAERRAGVWTARKRRLHDLIGGVPSAPGHRFGVHRSEPPAAQRPGD